MSDPASIKAAADQQIAVAEELLAQAHTVKRAIVDRRSGPRQGGRRASDRPSGNAWTTAQVAYHIGMSPGFVLCEIKAGDIVASQFGREWRITHAEVVRYCEAKGWPAPSAPDAPAA